MNIKFEFGKWYPTKTAPQDVGRYLVGKYSLGKWIYNIVSFNGENWTIWNGGWYGPDFDYIEKLFTHWSPMPKPPRETSARTSSTRGAKKAK